MSWTEHHSLSENLAARADTALKEGRKEESWSLYRNAATEEEKAFSDLDVSKQRTIGVTAISAVSLWYKARAYQEAETAAHRWLGGNCLPDFASVQLQELLQTIWNEKAGAASGIEFMGTEILVSVKGGMIVHGGAPLEIVAAKVEQVSALFYRTIELLLDRPHRSHGGPPQEIQDVCTPWLFQTVPGSYQFAVRVQGPAQGVLAFADAGVKSERVASKFLEIVKATAEDPEGELVRAVPDSNYRSTFLKLTRNLTPVSGGRFDELQIRPALNPDHTVTLRPQNRRGMSDAIRKSQPHSSGGGTEQQIRGVLRAVHLDKDWLEVVPDSPGGEPVRIVKAGEAVDDVVGPMVNHKVTVDVFTTLQGRHHFRDIQRVE